MAKLVLVCGVRLATGAWQLCEERREFGTGTSLRAASTRGRAQCPAPRHGRPRGGRPSPLGHPLYTEPARDKVGPLEPDMAAGMFPGRLLLRKAFQIRFHLGQTEAI